jgi:putative transposase
VSIIQAVARLYLRKGEVVVINIGERSRLLRIDKVTRQHIFFVDIDSGEERFYRHKNIRKLYSRGDLRTLEFYDASDALGKELARRCSTSFAALPQKVQEEGVRNQWAMQELQRLEAKLGSANADAISMLHQAVKDRFGTIAGLSRAQLFKKRARWLASGGKIESVTPDFANRGNADSKVDERIDEISKKLIRELYATRTHPQRNTTYLELIRLINEENKARPVESRLRIPSPGYLKRRIEQLDPYHLTALREGEDVARRKHGGFGPGERPTRPLEVVQIDHTPLDIIAIDDDFRVVIGRVYLTLAIDAFSRCILGIHVSYEPPNYHSVAKCLANAISFKDHIVELYGLENEWRCHGVPQVILVDNGTEFKSVALESLCTTLNISIHYTRKRKSHLKGVVERLFRTINRDHFQSVAGTSFSNYLQLKGYDPKKFTMARVSNIIRAMHILVVDILHQRGHRALLSTPIAVWDKYTDEFPPRMPPSQTELQVLVGREMERPVHHYGVELNHLRYRGARLPMIRNNAKFAPGKKYRVKIDPDDVRRIHVLNDDGKWILLEVDDDLKGQLAGFSVAHWKALRKFSLLEFRKSIDKVGIAVAMARFREVLTTSVKRMKKQVSRKLLKELHAGKAMADGENSFSERTQAQTKFAPADDGADDDDDLNLDDNFEVELDD